MTDDRAAATAATILAELVPRLGRLIAGALETDPEVALSLRQYRMLERLTERPHRTGELASISGVSQPTASAAVAALESRGMVDRRPDPSDRRATLIEINQEGRALYVAARQRVLDRLSVITAEMTHADAEALAALQPVLTKGMNRLIEQLRQARR